MSNDISIIEQDRQRMQEKKGVFTLDDLLDYLPPKILPIWLAIESLCFGSWWSHQICMININLC